MFEQRDLEMAVEALVRADRFEVHGFISDEFYELEFNQVAFELVEGEGALERCTYIRITYDAKYDPRGWIMSCVDYYKSDYDNHMTNLSGLVIKDKALSETLMDYAKKRSYQ